MVKDRKTIAVLLFIISFSVYFLSSNGDTPYNHYTLLAKAFLQGNTYITKYAPWLEQVPKAIGSFYVANPPLPAILAMPFVAVFGENFSQQLLAHLLGAGCVVTAFFIALKIKASYKSAVWSALLMGFGNIIWFLAADGSMWYLAQVTGVFFALLSVNELVGKKRIVLITFFIGLAFLARIQLIFYLPFLILAVSSKNNLLKNVAVSFFAIAPIIIVFGIYNYVRFGSFFETGLKLIPGLINEPWFRNGLFNLSYIPGHLRLLFAEFPVIKNEFPFVYPTLSGLAIWITSPIFIVALNNNIKDKIVLSAWATIIFITLVDLAYGSAGISQFGYRYAVDVYPLLFLLTVKSVGEKSLKPIHWVLLIISVLVNLWGITFINKLGFKA
jgi:hypothetical protein